MIVYAVLLYICLLAFIIMTINAFIYVDADQSVFDHVVRGPMITGGIFAALSITAGFFVVLFSFIGKEKLSYGFIMTMKMVLIPYYVGNFVLWALYGLGLFMAINIFATVFIAFGVAFTYVTMMGTSLPLLSKLLDEYRKKAIPRDVFVISVVCLFIYFADVAVSAYLYIQSRKKEEAPKEEIEPAKGQ